MTMMRSSRTMVSHPALKKGEKLLKGKSNMVVGISAASILFAHTLLNETSFSYAMPAETTDTTQRWQEVLAERIEMANTHIGQSLQNLGKKIFEDGMKFQLLHEEQQEEQRIAQQPAAKFPSLRTHLMTNEKNKMHPFQLNANEPIPIENEFFVGHITLIFRPLQSHHDPNYADKLPPHVTDEEPDTTYWFQLEGKFKKPMLKNQVFVGGELTNRKMNLGTATRKISDLILRLLNKTGGGQMLYSFGSEEELPHISFPLHAAMYTHKVVKKRNGNNDKLFPDDDDDENDCWNTSDTYSLSYSAKSIDLARWKILLPFEINLERFWGKSDLRLVIYEKDVRQQFKKNYLFNLQLDHLGTSTKTAAASSSAAIGSGLAKSTTRLATSPEKY